MFSRSILGRGSLYLLKPSSTSSFHISARSSFAAATHAAMADTMASANSSGITPASLKETLTVKLNAEHVEIEDLSGGCGSAFHAIIVSPQFDKKTMLARHRLVNSALKEEIAAIHAWTPKCYTPEQWAKLKEGE